MNKKYDGLIIEDEPFCNKTILDFMNIMDIVNEKYSIIYDYYSLSIVYIFDRLKDAIDVMELICKRTRAEFPTLAVRNKRKSYKYNDYLEKTILVN